ncbi:hypothetical protein [Streptomyces sp. T028]
MRYDNHDEVIGIAGRIGGVLCHRDAHGGPGSSRPPEPRTTGAS